MPEKKLAVSRKSKSKFEAGSLNPYYKMKKAEIIEELDCRNVDYEATKEPELEDELTRLLHGAVRPPALLLPDLTKTAEDLNLGNYEVVGCEPMHDLTNIVMNVITELPNILSDPLMQKEFKKFHASTIGDKSQVKGSHARLFAVQLVQLATKFYEQRKIDKNIKLLITSLEDIISICYSQVESRSPKSILRLYNQTLLFAITSRAVFGVPSKLTARKFFGTHFHGISVHAAEIYRIFNLRSIITEREERCFSDLKSIAEHNTNRQPGQVIDNTVLRFNSKHASDDRCDSFLSQDTLIKQQAKLLPKKSRSVLSSHLITHRPALVQAHLERIPDFLVCGKDIWWTSQNGDIIFMDGPDDPPCHESGPPLHHFRQWSLKKEKQYLSEIWKNITKKFEKAELLLPLTKIKVFENDGKVKVIENKRATEMTDQTGKKFKLPHIE